MSAFVNQLSVTLACGWANDGVGQWQVNSHDFGYQSDKLGKLILVPYGFHTDFASVPKSILAWGFFGGRYATAAVVHDYLLYQGYVRRKLADKIFLEAMRVQNVLELEEMRQAGEDEEVIASREQALEGRCYAMYLAVSLSTLLKEASKLPDYKQPGYNPIGNDNE